MEFQFNVNRLLPRKINKISHTLVPEDFRGDRRELNECQRLLGRVLDDMGEASAKAQGLSKPITSAVKLRDTDHYVYLLVDSEGNNGYGCVVGLLKTGSKNLFMFDEKGMHYQLQPRCILDFYVHESRQRMGLGNVLYQHMLAEEHTRPVKLAIDRPSEKFLQFLRKHYGLDRIIPQNNKFVVFRGFFDDESQDVRGGGRYSLPPRSASDGEPHGNNNQSTGGNNCNNSSSSNGAPYSAISRSAYGRYAAARPPCSMANIIHNAAVLGQAAERTGELPATAPKLERPRSLSLYSEEEQKQRTTELSTVPTPAAIPDHHQPTPFVPSSEQPVASASAAATRHRRPSAASSTATAMQESRATSAARVAAAQESRASSAARAVAVQESRAASAAKAAAESRAVAAANVAESRAASAANAAESRASSAAFGPLVDHQTTRALASMDLESSGPVDNKPTTGAAAAGAAAAGGGGGSTSSSSSVKASPSCAQEVGGNQSGHLDLKFYHSPLW